jgi:glutamate racemase
MEPGVKPAAERTRSGVIGVLATEASLAGEKFHQLVNTHASGVRVITRPCPRFVELVEAGILDGPEAEAAVDEALAPLLEAGADVFVLGCTHYPFLRPVIERRLPQGAVVIDTGPAVAKRVASLLPEGRGSGDGGILVETTGPMERLQELLPRLLAGFEVRSASCRIGNPPR